MVRARSGRPPVPFVLASVAACSRIYYRPYLPLDIVGGAGLGLICGSLTLLITREPQARDHGSRMASP